MQASEIAHHQPSIPTRDALLLELSKNPEFQKYATKRVGPGSAIDSIQDAMVRLLKFLAGVDGEIPLQNPKAWMQNALRWETADEIQRQRQSSCAGLDILDDQDCCDATPCDIVGDAELRECRGVATADALQSLESLYPRYYRAIILHIGMDFPISVVAKVLKISENAVHQRLHNGKPVLRGLYTDSLRRRNPRHLQQMENELTKEEAQAVQLRHDRCSVAKIAAKLGKSVLEVEQLLRSADDKTAATFF